MTSFAIEPSINCCTNLVIPKVGRVQRTIVNLTDNGLSTQTITLKPSGEFTYYTMNITTLVNKDINVIVDDTDTVNNIGDRMTFLFTVTDAQQVTLKFETTLNPPQGLYSQWQSTNPTGTWAPEDTYPYPLPGGNPYILYPKNVFATFGGNPSMPFGSVVGYVFGIRIPESPGNSCYNQIASEFIYDGSYWVNSSDNY